MTKSEFSALAENTIILDGATGSNLMAAGMPRGVCTEEWVLDHKDVIQKLQRAYVEAGSRILYAPTFGGNRRSLEMHGLENRIREINTTLTGFAREAAGGKALIAGDLTTTGKMMGPLGDLSYEEAYEIYTEQISILYEAGVDLLVAETMISIEEALACVDAASTVCDLPIMCTMTVEADGSIYTGGNAMEAAAALESAGASAVGVNCSVGPDQLVSVIASIRDAVTVPVIAKPNAGMPQIDDRGIAVYHMTPDSFAEHMKILKEQGASILGGCCGTSPEYIRALCRVI